MYLLIIENHVILFYDDREEVSKTWFTYGWALCWANVDSEDLIDQESKAGFWNQEIQVEYFSF